MHTQDGDSDFWDKFKAKEVPSFFDVRVFNSHYDVPSNQISPSACYRQHELEKGKICMRGEYLGLSKPLGYFTPLHGDVHAIEDGVL
jgi:hypothetical protein